MNSLQQKQKSMATVCPKNRLLLALLDEWMSEEETDDDKVKMEQFEADLQQNRIVFSSLEEGEARRAID